MARTNSRKISRRALKKKSPLPAVMILLYMAGLCMIYVWLHMENSKLNFELEVKESEVVETQNRIRNLAAKVEMRTNRKFIFAKIKEFNMRLEHPVEGQVVEVSHYSTDENPEHQSLREGNKEETTRTLTKR
jgi:hypothetical protein